MSPMSQNAPSVNQRHASELDALLQAVLKSQGVTSPAMREAAFQGGELPPALRDYATKVRGDAYRITDDEVKALLAAGYSQDAVFEITVAIALGAAAHRLETGLRAMRQEP